MGDPAVTPDRGGIWPVPFQAHERALLTQQAKYDRRNVPLLWYWRLLRPEDGLAGGAPDEVLDEEPELERSYAAPIALHLYVDWTPEKKGKTKGRTETTGTTPIAISRAEGRRIGRILKTRDDSEGLVADSAREDFIFIPRPEDIFRARGRYYEIQQMSPQWLGASSVVALWKGTSVLVRDDATEPGFDRLSRPPALHPPLPEVVPWLG